MPDNNNNNYKYDNGTNHDDAIYSMSAVHCPRCPFASWLFAYFYHRFGGVAATEIIDKVFNQPLTLTQRHNVYSVCVCVCVRGERFYRLPGITIIKRPPQSSETRQQFSVFRSFVCSDYEGRLMQIGKINY